MKTSQPPSLASTEHNTCFYHCGSPGDCSNQPQHTRQLTPEHRKIHQPPKAFPQLSGEPFSPFPHRRQNSCQLWELKLCCWLSARHRIKTHHFPHIPSLRFLREGFLKMAPSDPFPTTPYISSSVGRLQLLMFVRWLHASYALSLPTLQSKAEDSSVVSDCLNSSWNHPCSASMSPPLLNSPCVPAIPSSHITSALSVFSLSSKQLFSAHS